MKHTKLIVFQVIVGVLFAFFYSRLTIPKFDDFKLKILDIRGSCTFQLPQRGTYLLKIFGDDIPEKVYFNSNRVVHSIFRNRTKLKEFYYILPAEITKKGANKLFMSPDDRRSVKIMNNIASTDFGAILFKSSIAKNGKIPLFLFFSFIFIFIAWGLGVSYILKVLFNISLDNFFIRYCFSYFPCLLLLYFFDKASIFLPVRLLFLERSYMGVISLLILSIQIPVLFAFILQAAAQRPSGDNYSNIIITSGKNISKQLIGYRAVAWAIKKDFSDKCILFFIALLFSCALLLSFNLSFIAEFLANLAYLSLVTGVIIKLKKARSEPNEDRPA